ncbi:MAG TPA: glycosyltransferase family 39 protein [Candidatus Acidoferrum sp.]|nr:glycosyltransferase family 39 protein [Candidatus Acidoferrum sp.]
MAAPPRAHAATVLRDAVLVVALAAVLVVPPVSQRLIVTSHEARFALIARDMLNRHVWFDVKVRGVPYRNKPPLHPWSIAAGSWWRGRVTDGSARLPSALATVATVLGAFLLAQTLFGRRAGLWAALVMATSYGVFAHSQMILPDVPMIAFATFAGYAFWRAMTGPAGGTALVAFYAMLALGVFVKGPAGLLPLAVAIVWLWTEHGVSGLRKLWSLPGVALFVALSLVWLVPFVAFSETDRVVRGVLWLDWIRYYFRAPRPGTFAAQFLELLGGFLPWTLLAPFAFVHAFRTRSEPPVRFAILWFAVQFVLIMAATSQRVRYLLSLYPGLALLVAWWAADDRRPRRAAVVTWTAAAMAVALFSGVWIYNGRINAKGNFKALAATVERHARGGEVGVFVSKGEYLQIDYYLGRNLKTLDFPSDLAAYVAKPERPVVVVNQENWERHERQMPPGLRVLEAPFVGGETMRLVRLGPPAP